MHALLSNGLIETTNKTLELQNEIVCGGFYAWVNLRGKAQVQPNLVFQLSMPSNNYHKIYSKITLKITFLFNPSKKAGFLILFENKMKNS